MVKCASDEANSERRMECGRDDGNETCLAACCLGQSEEAKPGETKFGGARVWRRAQCAEVKASEEAKVVGTDEAADANPT